MTGAGLTSDEVRGHLAMLGFSALVAGSFSLGAIVANDIAPQAITAARFVLATIVMGMVAFLQGDLRREYWQAPWRYFVLGALFTLYFVLMFEGLKTANPVSVAAVFTLMPLMSALFGWWLLRQVTTPRMALALGIAACGALWVIFRGDPAALWAFDIGRGEMIYFVGCIAHALYTPMVRKLNRGEGAAVFTFGMLVAGSVILGVVGFDDIRATDWAALPGMVWITIAYLTLFSTASSFFLLQYASLRLPSAKVMAYSYLTPAWVMLWEIGLGSMLPPTPLLFGIGATIIALLMLLRKERATG
ncbi:MAG TPA: EamA family transporter [Alphaproteobacteria bacterium]|jgi:drug/metabolite transporter (DMT)-like permease|nr:EamA family transporter [Alphaproteobacteria bacterium]|tara:strand:+ start:2021 stop:2929 length:909 start_codon:yes stop_codon:yes gene_type:complete